MGERCKLFQQRLELKDFPVLLTSPSSIFCYTVKCEQLQKSLNLAARKVPPTPHVEPEITQAGGGYQQ